VRLAMHPEAPSAAYVIREMALQTSVALRLKGRWHRCHCAAADRVARRAAARLAAAHRAATDRTSADRTTPHPDEAGGEDALELMPLLLPARARGACGSQDVNIGGQARGSWCLGGAFLISRIVGPLSQGLGPRAPPNRKQKQVLSHSQ